LTTEDLAKVDIDLKPWLGVMQASAGNFVYYKNVPLWFGLKEASISELDIFLLDGSKNDSGCYMLCCIHADGDGDTYGLWDTEEAARKWLANPVIIE
jgi:hypothetical protein